MKNECIVATENVIPTENVIHYIFGYYIFCYECQTENVITENVIKSVTYDFSYHSGWTGLTGKVDDFFFVNSRCKKKNWCLHNRLILMVKTSRNVYIVGFNFHKIHRILQQSEIKTPIQNEIVENINTAVV